MASVKLTVHEQRSQNRLSHASESYDHYIKVVGSAGIFIERECLVRRTVRNHDSCRQGGVIEDVDIFKSVVRVVVHERGDVEVFICTKNKPRACSRDLEIFHGFAEASRVSNII